MASPLRLKEMRLRDVAAALERDPRLIVPVGTCEEHGEHLPLGAGTIIVERLADDLSAQFQVLRAPTIEYGVNVPTEVSVPGSGSLRRKTVHRMLNDLIATWEAHGVRQTILLTAQGYDPHLDALSTVRTGISTVRVIDILATGIADLLEGQPVPLRADEADTALMLFLAPDLVDMTAAIDRIVPSRDLRRYRMDLAHLAESGAGLPIFPSLASAEKGQSIYRRIRDRVASRVFAHDLAREMEEE